MSVRFVLLESLHLKIQLVHHLTHHQPMHHFWEQGQGTQFQTPGVKFVSPSVKKKCMLSLFISWTDSSQTKKKRNRKDNKKKSRETGRNRGKKTGSNGKKEVDIQRNRIKWEERGYIKSRERKLEETGRNGKKQE